MPMTDGLALAAVIGLVFVNAFFVAAEFAIVTIRRARVDALVRSGSRRAKILSAILGDLDAHISAIQLAITAVGLAIGWLGEPAIAANLSDALKVAGVSSETAIRTVSFLIAFLFITSLVVIAGELAPKFLGLRRTEQVALSSAPLIYGIARATRPVLNFMNASAGLLLRLIGVGKGSDAGPDVEPEELRLFLSELAKLGRLSSSHRKMLENVFEFAEHSARQVMVPRDQIEYLALERPLEENAALLQRSGHTRYPLCKNDLDSVIGMIHIKDFYQRADAIKTSDDLRLIQHDMLFVPESQSIDALQRLFQRRRTHMAIVVDEYGVPTGLVTMEDVLEELVGEIQDEFDTDETPKIEKSKDGLLVDGMLLIADLCRELDIEIGDVDVDTVGGFVTSALGKIARVGDRFSIGNYSGRVVEMQGRRVARVLLNRAEGETTVAPPQP
jgi:CBS domain containing-hemolysin-like protein